MRNKLVLAAISIGTMLAFAPASHAGAIDRFCVYCNPGCTVTTGSCPVLELATCPALGDCG